MMRNRIDETIEVLSNCEVDLRANKNMLMNLFIREVESQCEIFQKTGLKMTINDDFLDKLVRSYLNTKYDYYKLFSVPNNTTEDNRIKDVLNKLKGTYQNIDTVIDLLSEAISELKILRSMKNLTNYSIEELNEYVNGRFFKYEDIIELKDFNPNVINVEELGYIAKDSFYKKAKINLIDGSSIMMCY